MKRLAVDLDEELHRRLKELAAREDKTVSEIVRQVIAEWVNQKRPE